MSEDTKVQIVLSKTDEIRVTVSSLERWMELLELNPRDIAPRIQGYLDAEIKRRQQDEILLNQHQSGALDAIMRRLGASESDGDYLVVRFDAAEFIVKKAYEYGKNGWDKLQCEAEIGSAAFIQPELAQKDEVISRLEAAIDKAGLKVADDPNSAFEKPDWILVPK